MNDVPRQSVTETMANRFGMTPSNFEQVLRATVLPKECTREQFAAFLLIAKKYNLDPIARELYAFPRPGGGIQPIVSIDGWMAILNSHPQMDGVEFEDVEEDGELIAIKCRIHRKDRKHPTEVIEYMSECRRNTDTWRQWPIRMLRHKAAIQAARYAFGFSGIVDPDEFERWADKPPPQPRINKKRQMAEEFRQSQEPREIWGELPTEEPLADPAAAVEESAAEAYVMGQEGRRTGAKRDQFPARFKDAPHLVDAWQAGWDERDAEIRAEIKGDSNAQR